MKLKLTGSGFEGYTGQMGVHYFENGLSINEVLPVDAMRIAGAIGAVWEDGSPANVGEIYAASLHSPAALNPHERNDPHAQAVYGVDASAAITQSNVIAQAQFKAEGIATPVVTFAEKEVEAEPKRPTPVVEDGAPRQIYTRQQLESIVDKDGFAGLRKIAEPFGVKGTSINALIDSILSAQGGV
ncbi:hypothetical protein [Acinetobacter brisouii]|uniref:hypothetical protein n=1 Tax=Acinetobacter brisouii TaxID=396323 RepID=UPI00124F1B19|nr:hypothetical protein [Acinetobacter brisouii]